MKIKMNNVKIDGMAKAEMISSTHNSKVQKCSDNAGPIDIQINVAFEELCQELEPCELPDMVREIAATIKNIATAKEQEQQSDYCNEGNKKMVTKEEDGDNPNLAAIVEQSNAK